MRALALWALAAVLVPACGQHPALRKSSLPLSDTVDAALRARTEVAKFGPGNCISTWRNEDGHCEVATQCKDHDISKYAVKFICIDESEDKVRHVFAPGSFDSEEQFDTLIECKKCLAEKQDTIQVIDDGNGKKAEEIIGPVGSQAASLTLLREEVKELEAALTKTSAAVQKLNAKVYHSSAEARVKKEEVSWEVEKQADLHAQAAAGSQRTYIPAKIDSSLVHHATALHIQRSPESSPMKNVSGKVERAHHRHDAEKQGDVNATRLRKVAAKTRPKRTDSGSSLANAVRTAEVRDHKSPPQQPARLPMVIGTTKIPQALQAPATTAQLDDDAGEDADGEDYDSVPQNADGVEQQEEPLPRRPSISAIQQNQDDEDDENAEIDYDDSP